MTLYLAYFSAFILLLGLFSLGFAWVTIHQYRKRREFLETIITGIAEPDSPIFDRPIVVGTIAEKRALYDEMTGGGA